MPPPPGAIMTSSCKSGRNYINATKLQQRDLKTTGLLPFAHSGAIPIAEWAGQSVELFFGLVGGTSTNATVTIDAMRFYQLAPPSLSIAVTNGQAIISWPAAVQGFALQSANALNQTWNTMTNTPTTNGLWNIVTDPLTATGRFYRLKQ